MTDKSAQPAGPGVFLDKPVDSALTNGKPGCGGLRAGDEWAFSEIVDGWSPMMLRVAAPW